MTPIFFTLENRRPLMIVPDTRAQMDGHPVLTYNYNIYLNKESNTAESDLGTVELDKLTKLDNPAYLGYITFVNPGKSFTYTQGERALSSSEVREIIEHISHIRDNPDLWKAGNIKF